MMAKTPKRKKPLKISKTDTQDNSEISSIKPSIEDYQILDKLGEGGMGSVWHAIQISTHREVALKVMVLDAFSSDKARSRFEREVELAARLASHFFRCQCPERRRGPLVRPERAGRHERRPPRGPKGD